MRLNPPREGRVLEHGADAVGSFTATGPVKFEGLGGVHSSDPLEDPKDRSGPGRSRHNPRYAPASERIGPRPGTLLSLSLS